jgi:hypothetical protein
MIDTLLQCTSQGRSCPEAIVTSHLQSNLLIHPRTFGHLGLTYFARLIAVTHYSGVVIGATSQKRVEAEQLQWSAWEMYPW